MRQLLSLRLGTALGALVLLALAVNAVVVDDDDLIEAVVEQTTPPVRQIDLIDLVETFERSADFGVTEAGVTEGALDMVLGPERVLQVAPGTPGQIECANLRASNRCVVFADLIGEAVIWFAVLPRGPRDTVVLPPIIDLDDGYAIFDNGWRIRYPPVIERTCDEDADITSFSDFLRRFGPDSTTIVDLETRQVSEVVCGDEFVPTTTTVAPPEL